MGEPVIGLSDLDRALGELPKSTARNALRRSGLAALVPFVERWKELAPVDADPASTPARAPGTYRDSIHAGTKLNASQAKTAKREGKSFVEVYAGTSDRAGVQTEFGNVHQAAQPAGRSAWDASQTQVLERVGSGLFIEIQKAAERLARKALKGG
jgi:hypothetical protein